ncbi:hypothetical protein ZIOFF_031337 [Zingiber officinale]|uniref:Uncharacterized protein n=1 Tax=Zingiber officinale TaxID=94328 RepID=A0A8J5GGF1_ZINOF|nr:hypothetical protein ZIOFF_031337 [Zingiber officinale]
MVARLLHGHAPVAAALSPHLPRFPKPLSAFPFCRRPSLSDRPSTPRTVNAVGPNSSSFPNPHKQMQQQQQVRTLFPGGFKRPEISVPTLVLRLSVDESLERGAEIDFALPKGVGVVTPIVRCKEVAFLLYVQQWKKKVVFVLNELDLYRTSSELEEATSFVKEKARRLLNSVYVDCLFPVSAQSALDAKLSSSSYSVVKYKEALFSDSRWMSSQFYEPEKFLFSLLDGTTESGLERVNVKDYSAKIKSDRKSMKLPVTWRKSITSLYLSFLKMQIETTKSRALKLTYSLLRLSNIDLIPAYALKAERTGSTFTISTFQNDIINPALSDARDLVSVVCMLHTSMCRTTRIAE